MQAEGKLGVLGVPKALLNINFVGDHGLKCCIKSKII